MNRILVFFLLLSSYGFGQIDGFSLADTKSTPGRVVYLSLTSLLFTTNKTIMRSLLLLLAPLSIFAQDKKIDKTATAKAVAFVNALNAEQKTKAVFPFEETNRFNWHFVPPPTAPRTGIAVKDMDGNQKKLFYMMLQSFLSPAGYQRTQNIMSFEYVLKEMEPNSTTRIPENYFVSVYGNPGKDNIWAWKFTGHHLALNFTVVDGELAFTPFFFGSNPGEIKEGAKKGMRIIIDEEDLAFKLVNSLNDTQKKTALFRTEAFADIVSSNSPHVSPLESVGILLSDMDNDQKNLVNKIMVAYLSSMPQRLANMRMKLVATEDKNEIRFGWAGGLEKGKPHYYRIQGKTFLIEFDNTQNNANHIHEVWRDFNGDYGEDMLKEHYQHSHQH